MVQFGSIVSSMPVECLASREWYIALQMSDLDGEGGVGTD